MWYNRCRNHILFIKSVTMQSMQHPRHCLNCSTLIRGRCDKKFCNEYCRSIYNNKKNQYATNLMQRICAKLRRNHKIINAVLANHAPDEPMDRQYLIDRGFDFQYVTEMVESSGGDIIYCCFDMAYSIQSDGIRFMQDPKQQHILKVI